MKIAASSLVLGLVCAAVSPLSAVAAIRNPSINRLEHREQLRIKQGIRSGELTRTEARRLEAQQARIRVDEKLDKADGRFTPAERRQLHRELHRASRDIHDQKHDNQDRN